MAAAPQFDSAGFRRDQQNHIGVFLVDLDGNPYVASGGTGGGGGGVVQMQLREGAAWVNVPGSGARGLLIDPVDSVADASVGLPAKVTPVAGYDGSNVRTLKTSAIGALQVDVLSKPAGDATAANQATQITAEQAIRDRLPTALVGGRLDVNVGVLPAGSQAAQTALTADYDTGAGTALAPMQGLALPASGGAVAGGTAAAPVRTDPTGTTTQPVSGTVTANAGTGPFPVSDNAGSLTVDAPVATPLFARLSDGAAALTTTGGRLSVDASGVAVPVTDNAGSLTVDAPVGTPLFARLSDGAAALIGQKTMAGSLPVAIASDQGTLAASLVAGTTGGVTTYRLLSAATTNANNIKGSAGKVYGWVITNTNAAARFVKLYNKATAPTVGTDTPLITLVIPGNTAGAGIVTADISSGIAFGTGIGIAITAVVTDADATAVAANEVVVNLFYL